MRVRVDDDSVTGSSDKSITKPLFGHRLVLLVSSALSVVAYLCLNAFKYDL